MKLVDKVLDIFWIWGLFKDYRNSRRCSLKRKSSKIKQRNNRQNARFFSGNILNITKLSFMFFNTEWSSPVSVKNSAVRDHQTIHIIENQNQHTNQNKNNKKRHVGRYNHIIRKHSAKETKNQKERQTHKCHIDCSQQKEQAMVVVGFNDDFIISQQHKPEHQMVRPTRFERVTFALEGHCSIQLSYGRMPRHYTKMESLFLAKIS